MHPWLCALAALDLVTGSQAIIFDGMDSALSSQFGRPASTIETIR
jgi:hypothetical protein